MNNSFKIGAVAGLFAGIVAGIVATICYILHPMLGLTPRIGEWPVVNAAEYYIIMNLIWGIIYGLIFSRFHGAIPGRGIMKGFYYGLVLFLLTGIRITTYLLSYGYIEFSISWLFITFFASIVYGTLLGALYKTRARTIGKYDIGRGFNAGAIAGIIGGILAFLSRRVGMIYFFEIAMVGPEWFFIFYQFIIHTTLNALWGAIYGIIFTKVYDLVPRKVIKKGFVYGLLAFLVGSLHFGTYMLALAVMVYLFVGYEMALPIFQNSAIPPIFTGAIQAITFGIVLGYLYRKPRK